MHPRLLLVGGRGRSACSSADACTDGLGGGTEAAGRSLRGNAPW